MFSSNSVAEVIPRMSIPKAVALTASGITAGYFIYHQTLPRFFTKPTGESPIERQFYEYASVQEEDKWYMTKEDFCKVCGIEPWELKQAQDEENNDSSHFSVFQTLTNFWDQRMALFQSSEEQSKADFEEVTDFFNRLDTNEDNKISVEEFSRFAELLRSPNADKRYIFLLSDCNRDNKISLKEFQQGMQKYVPEFAEDHPQLLHLESSELIQKHFGSKGDKQLGFKEFQGLLNELEELSVENDFKKLRSEDGTVPVNKISDHLISLSKRGSIPHHVLENIHRLKKETNVEEVSYTQYRALHNFIKHMQPIERFIKLHQTEKLSKEEFRESMKKESKVELGDAELDWVFALFANPKTGNIDSKSFSILCENLHADAAEAPKMKFHESLILGGVSSMIGVTAVFPLDKVKTRIQSGSTKKGIFEMMKEISAKEGPMKLYRGLQAELIGITPEKAIKITMNDFIRKKMKQRHQKESGNKKNVELSTAEEMLAGMGSGIIQVFISNPISVVKIRLQMQKDKGQRPIEIVRKLGFRGLYTGLSATILRDIPFSMMYFGTYQSLKSYFRKQHRKESNQENQDVELSAGQLLLASCVAGSLAGGLDTPADGIKTRLQNGEGKYSGVIDCVKKVYAKEGIAGMFRGCTARVLIISPFFGITMMTYELLQRFFFPNTRTGVDVMDEDFATIRKSKLRNLDSELQLRYH